MNRDTHQPAGHPGCQQVEVFMRVGGGDEHHVGTAEPDSRAVAELLHEIADHIFNRRRSGRGDAMAFLLDGAAVYLAPGCPSSLWEHIGEAGHAMAAPLSFPTTQTVGVTSSPAGYAALVRIFSGFSGSDTTRMRRAYRQRQLSRRRRRR